MSPQASANKSSDTSTITPPKQEKPDTKGEIRVSRALSVKQLGDLLGVSAVQVIKDLMRNGVMASINQVIDYDTAAIIAADFGFEACEEEQAVPETAPKGFPKYPRFQEDDTSFQRPRPPVVTIMGHVDHGKTTLLDAIRESNLAASETGSITQHIGAYQVEIHGQKITFLDTPGHEAFTAMRARGARVTDIAVLVIAADDGVMPQTIEAIDHARAAGVPMVGVINKMDKPNANAERVKQQLAENDLLIEEWGGDVICVPVSAKRREGISELLENILIVAEMAELKANPDRRAVGVVIESRLDNTKGPVATVLVQTGMLKVGDSIVAGETWGRIKAMFNDKSKRVKRAEPATPVEVLGLNAVPQAGETLTVLANQKAARALVQERQKERESLAHQPTKALSLDEIFAQIKAGEAKELKLILKTDVEGSIEPLKNSVERLASEEIRVKVIHSASGNITESDVMLAIASKGIIIGFNTRPEPGARRLAESERVDIRLYEVIYALVEAVQKALAGMLEPTFVDVIEGHAEVRAVFNIRGAKIAGVYVTDGKVTRGALARVMRNGQAVYESNVSSLRHFKEDVREMTAGFECGISIEGYTDFKIGDIIEIYRKERK